MSTAERWIEPAQRPPLRLYDIAVEYEQIEAALIENGGVITPEMEAHFDAIADALEDKVEKVRWAIRNREASAEACKAEIARIRDMQNVHANAAAGMRRMLHEALTRMGVDSVPTKTGRVWRQSNGKPSIRWTGEVDELPERFRRVKIELDAAKALEELKDKGELPAGFTVEHGESLHIK